MEYAGDLLTSYRSSESRDRSQDKAIGALSLETEVVLAERRAGQPEDKARDAPMHDPVQVKAGLLTKKRSDDVLVRGERQHQPSTYDIMVDDRQLQPSSRGVRAVSSFVAGSRALPATWRSQDIDDDEDYAAPG